jgi:glycosyltransferase involved in cell wall biosynthesis
MSSSLDVMPSPKPQMERVIIVTYEYPPLGGGGGVIFRDLAEELAKRIDVTVLTSGRKGLPAEVRDGRLRIVRTPVLMRNANAAASMPSMLSYFPSSWWTGRRLMSEHRYDLVHTSFAIPSGPSGILLARKFGLPHILSVHGGDIYDPSKKLSPHRTPGLKQTVRWVLQNSDRVVAQSSDTVERTEGIYGVRDVDCIPLAVRKPEFEPRSREALGIPRSAKVLVTVGRLVERKGLDQLLRVVAAIKDEEVLLLILGEGPMQAELESQARSLGLADRVRFMGFVSEDEKWQLLNISDLYVSTTLHEGFGIVFLEGMEVGLPVLCYDKGGQTDFVTDEVGGLVKVGDEGAFLKMLVEHLQSSELRARKSRAARDLVREYYIDRYADRYMEVYEQCLMLAKHR